MCRRHARRSRTPRASTVRSISAVSRATQRLFAARPCRMANIARPARVETLALGVDVHRVGVHGRVRDEQLGGDLPLGAPARQEAQHLELALGEVDRQRRERRPRGVRRPRTARTASRSSGSPEMTRDASSGVQRRAGAGGARRARARRRRRRAGGRPRPAHRRARRPGSPTRRCARGGGSRSSPSGSSTGDRARMRPEW